MSTDNIHLFGLSFRCLLELAAAFYSFLYLHVPTDFCYGRLRKFFMSSYHKDFFEAEELCNIHGAYLADILSKGEADFIKGVLGKINPLVRSKGRRRTAQTRRCMINVKQATGRSRSRFVRRFRSDPNAFFNC